MKKLIIIQWVLLAFLLGSCEKDSFDYQMAKPGINEIDSVYFSAGSKMMIADGQARLDFIVEAFRKVPFTKEDGVQVDSMVSIDVNTLPDGSVKIYKSSGEEVGMTFSTTDAQAGSISFYAQVGTIKSAQKSVVLRQKPVLQEPLFVDVIFHVFELSSKDPSYDALSYQKVQYSMLQEAIQNMNEVFNNKIGSGPNGASANVTFRLAARKADGTELAQAGWNLITYDAAVVPKKGTTWNPADFARYMDGLDVNGNPTSTSKIWDPQKFLNIVVMPSGANTSMGTVAPQWQLKVEGEEPLPGVANIITDRNEATMNYANTCVGIPRTLLFPGYGKKVEFYSFVGSFYGMKKTTLEVDYCEDTQKYDGSGQFSSLKKVGRDGDKFLANNAMDDERYPSLRNNFTLDQVNRMRKIMELCPGRDNGLTK